jgi:hypothetical protein
LVFRHFLRVSATFHGFSTGNVSAKCQLARREFESCPVHQDFC